jgi:hypothetical protein
MATLPRNARLRARARLAGAVALLAASGCGLAHETEPASSRHSSAGTAMDGDVETAPAEGLEAVTAAQPGDSTRPLGSAPGDVTTTPVERPDDSALHDGGVGVVACQQVVPELAPPVTSVEAMLRQPGDASLDAVLSVGAAVALDGDTLAVSALRNASQAEHGSVTVFVRSGEAWMQQAELVPPAGEPDNWFGQTLALSGDTLVVGAPEELFEPPYPGHGRVHVFTRSDGQWQLDATLTAESPADRDRFGGAIALDGDTLAVTVHQEQVGRVELFERDGAGSSFARVQTLLPRRSPGTQAESDWVGPIALDGDVLAVSVAPAVNDPGQHIQVYERRTAGWEPTAELVGDLPPETFGIALALEGRTLVVGDSYLGSATGSGLTPTGGAYVFERGCDGGWTQRALLLAETENLSGNFGCAVAIDGARVVVADSADPTHASGIDGEIGVRDFEDDYTGAVYVFGADGDGYALLHFLKPSVDAPRETYFGTAVAASAGRIAAGARGQDTAYVFR